MANNKPNPVTKTELYIMSEAASKLKFRARHAGQGALDTALGDIEQQLVSLNGLIPAQEPVTEWDPNSADEDGALAPFGALDD